MFYSIAGKKVSQNKVRKIGLLSATEFKVRSSANQIHNCRLIVFFRVSHISREIGGGQEIRYANLLGSISLCLCSEGRPWPCDRAPAWFHPQGCQTAEPAGEGGWEAEP